jgi:uncharacterized membrane protein
LGAALASAALLTTSHVQATPGDGDCLRYIVETVITPGPCDPWGPWGMSAQDMNDHGHIVGFMSCGAGQPRAWVWWGEGPVVQLPLPPGHTESIARAINNLGHIVGSVGNGVHERAFFYDGNTMALIEPPNDTGAAYTHGLNLNDKDEVIGYRADIFGGGPIEAFVWRDGVLEMLGDRLPFYHSRAFDINNAGTIVGYVSELGSWKDRAFRLTGDAAELFEPFSGWTSSWAFAINEAGEIAGLCRVKPPGQSWTARGFGLHDDEHLVQDLGTLPPPYDQSMGWYVGADGLIAGQCTGPNEPNVPCIWRNGGDAQDVRMLILDNDDLNLSGVRAINATGHLLIGTNGIVVLGPITLVPADLDGDCFVTSLDLLQLLAAWNTSDPTADLDGNGVVDLDDLLFLLSRWDT